MIIGGGIVLVGELLVMGLLTRSLRVHLWHEIRPYTGRLVRPLRLSGVGGRTTSDSTPAGSRSRPARSTDPGRH